MGAIPAYARRSLQDRLETHARTAWSERCARVDVRFRGEYAYIDAIERDPWVAPGASEGEVEQLRQTPLKLCRIAWTGAPDSWGFAFYKYSDDRYEPSMLLDGSITGSPELCFDTAAQLYLQ